VTPILNTGDDTWAPSGADFYNGDKIPQWSGKYFVATLRGNHLHMIDFDLQNNKVLDHQKLFDGEFGRLRDVATSPDGYLYVLTSNEDGRGAPIVNDDRILKIIPISEIKNFEQCIAAGNPIMESFPRQCRADDQTFVEEIEVQKIPDWVKNIFIWYGQDKVSEDELLNAIKFLVQQEIIKLD
ncbi:MAG: PQQ-dependent sugar dehydrogenase, partial [Nitrosopumilaceae archaeon]|nr:PQQ-dependent sugar dehydrogenase [Nitrosopumilaceae archaeon]